MFENKNNLDNTKNKKKYIEEIVNKFTKIEDTKKIRDRYIDLERGFTLVEFFNKNPKEKQDLDLSEEEIKAAHNALNVYTIFSRIGRDKIKQVKTFSVSSIGKFNRNEIIEIIKKFNKNNESMV